MAGLLIGVFILVQNLNLYVGVQRGASMVEALSADTRGAEVTKYLREGKLKATGKIVGFPQDLRCAVQGAMSVFLFTPNHSRDKSDV